MKRILIGLMLGAGLLMAATHICPADNMVMMWDGSITVINGYMFYEYRCPQGHTALIRSDQQ